MTPATGEVPLPELDIVVVAYGSPHLLAECLEPLDGHPGVVVVDNSSDPLARQITEQHGGRYLDPGANLGFAAGVNLGLAHRRPGADVLLLNPDASISRADVSHLHRVLRTSPDLAALAPRQRDASGQPAQVAWPWPSPHGAWLEAFGLGQWQQANGFVIGSVLLLRREAIDEIGGLDERFFLYAEEVDWQRRAVNRGWRVDVCPDITAVHLGAGTGGDPERRATHFYASLERYIRKHFTSAGWQSFRWSQIFGASVRARVFTGDRQRQAAFRAHLFRHGPVSAEQQLTTGDVTRPGSPAVGSPAGATRTASSRPAVVQVVISDAFAGVERYVCQVSNGLVGRGHEVTVVGGDPERMRRELDPRVDHRPATSIPAGLGQLARIHGYDLIHAHMTDAEAVAWATSRITGAPVVTTRHFARAGGSTSIRRKFSRMMQRSFSQQIAISGYVAGTVGAPTVLLHHAVNHAAQAPLREPAVLMLQRLEPEKSPELGLAAWSLSGLAARGWTLRLAGSGSMESQLKTLARELGVADSVEFLGHVGDTGALLASSSILLATPLIEGFGMAVVEGMAHGLPVVASAAGAHRETLGEEGFLVPPGDTVAMAAALDRLGGDRDLRRQVGAALRQRQHRLFSPEVHLDALQQIYRDALTGPSPARRS